MAERIRTTISIDSETYETFKQMAETANMSVSRCMGEWLADTVDGAMFVTQKMKEAKKAPMLVMREMQAMAAGLQEEVNRTADDVRAIKRASKRGGGQAPADTHRGS